jgi:hypothetical protein
MHAPISDYQQEQWEALSLIMRQLEALDASQRTLLLSGIGPYLEFRQHVDQFLATHFAAHCTQSCFENRLSACCSKDGIITFWADGVINALVAGEERVEALRQALVRPFSPHKCTYLGPDGCRWQVRPLMCAMFLCDPVQEKVFGADRGAERRWRELVDAAKGFRWPDRPVLFDWLETYFIDLGCRSSLMYINTSPGLMRIKRMALERHRPKFDVLRFPNPS